MKKSKRKLKLLPKLILLFIIIFIGYTIINSKPRSLEDIGYKQIEIKEINKLTKSEIDAIKKFKYNKNLVYIITNDEYDSNKLYLYLKYTEKYKDVDYLKVFKIINNKNFKEENMSEYMDYAKEYSADGIVELVNNYGKELKDERTVNLMKEKYYIHEYLNRYLSYLDIYPKLDYSEVVRNVNCNLDKVYYEDVSEADTSKGMYTLVNKFYYLTDKYESNDIVSVKNKYTKYSAKLNKDAYEAFKKMADDMAKEDLTIKITTGYRNYNFQKTLYNNYVESDGVKAADTYSARPGYSEHQLGYSADITNGDLVSFDEFENTEEFKWLQKNAYKYGFILRFPKGKDDLTGYIYESWHYRYVGKDVAKYIHENDITYEEYYAYFLR